MALSRIQYPSPGFSKHWQQPAGRRMLQRIGSVPSKEEIDAFNTLYEEHDQLADDVVRELFEQHGHREGHVLLEKCLKEGTENIPHLPSSLKKLYEEALQKPSWLNETLLEAGSALCRRSGPFGLIVLRNYSLMGGYESAAINKPLIYTGALKGGPAKRLSETLSFWVDVTGQNALQTGAIGFNTTIKVRIIHALARAHTRKATDWSDAQWGVPINQGDMVATYLGFSLVFLEGLYMQGFRPSEEEVNGLFHLWKYIGYLLGIPAHYFPDTEQKAIETLYKWTMTQPPADDDTKSLALALMEAPLFAPYPPRRWQKILLVKIYLGFNQFFLGKEACDRMSLPDTVFRYLPYVSAFLNRFSESRIGSSSRRYQQAVNKGRKIQEEKYRRIFVRDLSRGITCQVLTHSTDMFFFNSKSTTILIRNSIWAKYLLSVTSYLCRCSRIE